MNKTSNTTVHEQFGLNGSSYNSLHVICYSITLFSFINDKHINKCFDIHLEFLNKLKNIMNDVIVSYIEKDNSKIQKFNTKITFN